MVEKKKKEKRGVKEGVGGRRSAPACLSAAKPSRCQLPTGKAVRQVGEGECQQTPCGVHTGSRRIRRRRKVNTRPWGASVGQRTRMK